MAEGKCLVVFYSRTGNTRKAAGQVARGLGCELEELTDARPRAGLLGFIKGGGDAMRKKLTQIGPLTHDPGDFDLVVLGTPVWAGTMTPAVRTYLAEQKDRLPEVAFFLTTGGSGVERTFRHMEEMCGKAPKATLDLRDRTVRKGDPSDAIRVFVGKLRA
jgi:menaquinone-dependent protoporphyrinogen IX oxidase